MLLEFTTMWDGSLGDITTTKHRIDFLLNPKPFSQPSDSAGPKAREEDVIQMERMLRAGAIEPAQTPWASPVLLSLEADGSWLFFLDWHPLNSVTIRDTYPILRMD